MPFFQFSTVIKTTVLAIHSKLLLPKFSRENTQWVIFYSVFSWCNSMWDTFYTLRYNQQVPWSSSYLVVDDGRIFPNELLNKLENGLSAPFATTERMKFCRRSHGPFRYKNDYFPPASRVRHPAGGRCCEQNDMVLLRIWPCALPSKRVGCLQ